MKIKHQIRSLSNVSPIHIIFKTNVNFSLQSKIICFYIKDLIKEIERRYLVQTIAFYISKNHIHLVIRSGSINNIPRSMQYLASKIALKINTLLGRKGKFWLDRYFSLVKRSAREIRTVLHYLATQNRIIACFNDPCSSFWEKDPWAIPRRLLNEIGIGKSSSKLKEVLLFNIKLY